MHAALNPRQEHPAPPTLMIRGVRDPRQNDDPAKVDAEICDNRGVVLLGVPICGTADFVERHLRGIVAKAERYVARLQALLLPDHFEEYQRLIQMTLPGRFAHVCRAVVPTRVVGPARAFDDLQLRAYSAGVGQLSSDDIPVRETVFMQQGAGGRGFSEMAMDCYSLYDGAWAQSAHRLATRLSSHPYYAPLRDISLPSNQAYGWHRDVEPPWLGGPRTESLVRLGSITVISFGGHTPCCAVWSNECVSRRGMGLVLCLTSCDRLACVFRLNRFRSSARTHLRHGRGLRRS